MKDALILREGDKVSLVATARKVTPEEVSPAICLLESWGLRVVIPDALYAAENQFAGSDSHRATFFQRQLDDPEIRAIFCVRGGYGTVRMVDLLDFTTFKRNPKWIVGYSDVTVLHSHIHCNCGVPTLHGTMPINITMEDVLHNPVSLASLYDILFHGVMQCSVELPRGATVKNRPGRCQAEVVGGNLSVLYSLIGSSSDIDTAGKILLIEDLDEYLYHIDRMMMALKRAGKFRGLKGLIVGAMSEMHDNTVPFGRNAEQIVRDAVAEYDFPVAYYCPFGHIGNQNHSLPLGLVVEFEVSENKAIVSVVM